MRLCQEHWIALVLVETVRGGSLQVDLALNRYIAWNIALVLVETFWGGSLLVDLALNRYIAWKIDSSSTIQEYLLKKKNSRKKML